MSIDQALLPGQQFGRRQHGDAHDLLYDPCACHALADRAALWLLSARRAGPPAPHPRVADAVALAAGAALHCDVDLERLSLHSARRRRDLAPGWRILCVLQSHRLAPGHLLAHLGLPERPWRPGQHPAQLVILAAGVEALLLPLHLASADRDGQHGAHQEQSTFLQL